MQVTSTFWAATQPIPRAERATIPHMNEVMHGFYMNKISEIFFGEKALFSALSQSMGAAPRKATLSVFPQEPLPSRTPLSPTVKV